MSAGRAESVASFVGKWYAREPEMRIVEVFCRPAERPIFQAWGALLHELREALFELSDPRITAIKTGWWAEEFLQVAQDRHRHPLTEALVGISAPWLALAGELARWTEDEVRAATTEDALGLLSPLAERTIAVEAALFGVPSSADAARALSVHWLVQRLPAGLAMEDRARIPLHLLARHDLTQTQLAQGQGEALLRDWARELSAALSEGKRTEALIRRARRRFDRTQLARIAGGKGFASPSAPASLWHAWRAGRGF